MFNVINIVYNGRNLASPNNYILLFVELKEFVQC